MSIVKFEITKTSFDLTNIHLVLLLKLLIFIQNNSIEKCVCKFKLKIFGLLVINLIFIIFSADPQYNSAVINTNVIVSHTGEVVWLSHGIFRSSCDIDVEYFPFDVQRCALKWASWTYDGYQVS